MKVAIYVRVSTVEQAKEGFSIAAQKQRLQAYCESQNWDIVGYFVDEGISAKNVQRPELLRMMEFIKQGTIDTVLVYKLDRLTRSVLDLYEMLKVFDKYNCKFKSATEVYDTTSAMGRMFITLVAALAQFERENLAERVSMGMSEKARQGKWSTHRPPFGYKVNDNYGLEVIPEEAELVKYIYESYLTKGAKSIAKELNKKIIEEGGITPRKSKYWQDTGISYILDNPIYIGTGRWHYRTHKENYFEIEDMAPAIISEELYEKVKSMRKNRSKVHPRRATSPFVFSGIARCGECGSTLMGKYGSGTNADGTKNKKKRNYQCTKKQQGLCDSKGVSEKYVEGQFLNVLSSWDITKEAIEESNPQDHTDDTEEQVSKLKRELKKIEDRRKKWQYAWANDAITDEDFTSRMNEENTREESITEELKSLQAQSQKPIVDNAAITEALTDLSSNWYAMSVDERKSFMQMFFKEFTVDRVNNKRSSDCIRIRDVKLH
ncbi:recombinase family protein [Pontibacillus salipaludis]|uniref:Integrase n=1 Tax=Pontibacillus salipaludis TaxID=1697394 RepID=A0ABQ1PW29_9BACI|nr:recombinase family protein [Pontibacillus salipaludis]GGD05089.1 integrase [Pontibacillus salipaludis]